MFLINAVASFITAFTSTVFLPLRIHFRFLPLTLLGLFLLGRWGKHRAAIALARSGIAVFYGWWNPPYLALLIVSIVLNFLLGGWLVKSSQGESGPRRLFLAIGIAANLGSIGYFKYANFLSTI
ncbi:MAG: hypothetical protein OSB76_10590 [Alphaproteobacteria bacterium]|nr:hypothetical protein [Alphaproteobacteria bacterium]